jgi:hypothetical protein
MITKFRARMTDWMGGHWARNVDVAGRIGAPLFASRARVIFSFQGPCSASKVSQDPARTEGTRRPQEHV